MYLCSLSCQIPDTWNEELIDEVQVFRWFCWTALLFYNWQYRETNSAKTQLQKFNPDKKCLDILYYVCMHANVSLEWGCACAYMCAMQCIYNINYSICFPSWAGNMNRSRKCVKTAVSKESLSSPDCMLPVFPRDSTRYKVVHYLRERHINTSWEFNPNVFFKERSWWCWCLIVL